MIVIAISWWGLTYIPFVRDMLPSIVSIEPTTRVDVESLPAGANTIPENIVGAACHNIPFLMRPLAGGSARTARIVFTVNDRDLGEVRFDCRTGDLLSERMY